ncbi:MAG: outer rane immunogenic protein [Methylobacteriaceae bacterium]|jgi:outer membrane immunogenic protein|nr:outer rane immunogenic protein [Methylobacteriaceae bacterium]
MKRLVSLAAALTLAGAANAADLPSHKAPPPVAVAPPLTFSGCYVGAFAGYDYARIRQRRDTLTVVPPFAFVDIAGAPGLFPGATAVTGSNYTTGSSGGDGGGRVGCNAQWGYFAAGVQIEGGALGISAQSTDATRPSTSINTRGGPYGALTGRVGFVLGTLPVWVYAKGGGAFTDIRYSNNDLGLFANVTSRGSGFAPVIGAGIEYKLTANASLTADYSFLRTRCGDTTYSYTTLIATPGFVAAPAAFPVTSFEHSRSCTDKHMFTVGLNYYFWSGPPAAVVARY